MLWAEFGEFGVWREGGSDYRAGFWAVGFAVWSGVGSYYSGNSNTMEPAE